MGQPRHDETEIRRRIGAVVRARAEGLGITAAALAVAAEIDDSQMSKVIAGKAGLSFFSLGRVAASLGTTAAAILADAMPREGYRVVRRRSGKPSRQPSNRR